MQQGMKNDRRSSSSSFLGFRSRGIYRHFAETIWPPLLPACNHPISLRLLFIAVCFFIFILVSTRFFFHPTISVILLSFLHSSSLSSRFCSIFQDLNLFWLFFMAASNSDFRHFNGDYHHISPPQNPISTQLFSAQSHSNMPSRLLPKNIPNSSPEAQFSNLSRILPLDPRRSKAMGGDWNNGRDGGAGQE